MEQDFWHERWQQQQIGFHQEEINPHLEAFWPELRIPPGALVFVPLCGKSGDMLWLCSQGYRVLGVELSPLAVEAFFAENGLVYTRTAKPRYILYESAELSIYCGDFFDLVEGDLEGVQAVFDRASLVALPTEMRHAYATHMKRLLPSGCRTLLVTFEYAQQEMAGPPFSVRENEVRDLYEDDCKVELRHTLDILPQEPRFRSKGLTRLEEKVYFLTFNGREGYA